MICIRQVLKNKLPLFLFILLFSGVVSCTEKDNKEQSSLSSFGRAGEIAVVMDSTLWKGPIGDTLRKIFSAELPGLLVPEPDFELKYVHPSRFSNNSILKRQRNLIFVTSLENNTPTGQRMRQFFSKDALGRINTDSTLFMYAKQNEFAQGQEILHLFGKTNEQLLNNLSKHKERVRNQFAEVERKFVQKSVYSKGEAKQLMEQLVKKHRFRLRIPTGFDLAKEDSNFVWIAKPEKEITKHIFVAYKPYTSAEAFKPVNIIAWRDSIGYNQMYNRKIENSYVTTQTYVLPTFKQVLFNGKFSVETRGLWKLANNSRGGTFLSYTFVDESTNRLYYLEAFLLAPSVDRKRALMRELETILWTFQPVDAVLAEKKSSSKKAIE